METRPRPMRVYLMRHATAEEPGGVPDAERRLTDQGRREAQEAGEALRRREGRPGVILTSPRLRARETAQLVAAAFPDLPVDIRPGLGTGASLEAYRAELGPDPAQELVLVGHNPELSTFASALVGEAISFRPATMCAVDLQDEGSRLLWIRHPGDPLGP